MRLREQAIDIDYNKTKAFFESRAAKYDEKYPYNTTMYQDSNKELTNKRNAAEQAKIMPYLKINKDSKIIDIACGVGRWGDAIECEIAGYYGIDFSSELIKIAKMRNTKDNYFFEEAAVQQLETIIDTKGWGKFDRVLMGGILIYLNDTELCSVFRTLNDICVKDAVIYIREPIGVDSRLTLKDFYSNELQCEYNAVYRTKQELVDAMKILLDNGFVIKREESLFDEDRALNNRKETMQYYFILERNNV